MVYGGDETCIAPDTLAMEETKTRRYVRQKSSSELEIERDVSGVHSSDF